MACELTNTLFSILLTQNIIQRTIPVIAFMDEKLLYSLGNVEEPGPVPGTPAPGDSFVTVYFRINSVNFFRCTTVLELLRPCGGRELDIAAIAAEGIPVSEVLKDGPLSLVRTGQTVTVNISSLSSVRMLSPEVVIPNCPANG